MVTKLKSKTTWVNRWEVTSRTDPDKTYVVGQKEDGSWGCACPRWIFNKERPRPDCKHILSIKASEPVDHSRTPTTDRDMPRSSIRVPSRTATAAEQQRQEAQRTAAAARGVRVVPREPAPIPQTTVPVFLLQTRRTIQLED